MNSGRIRSGSPPLATNAQANYILILFNDCGFSGEQMRMELEEKWGVRAAADLDRKQASECIEWLREVKGVAEARAADEDWL